MTTNPRPYSRLTNSQVERLAMLVEECGEVIQAATKVLRHGYESFDPDNPALTSNAEHLEREICDLLAVVRGMTILGDLGNEPSIRDLATVWLRKMQWTHHQSEE